MPIIFSAGLLDEIKNNTWESRELDLSEQELSEDDLQALVAALNTNPSIQSLKLQQCNITDDGATILAGARSLTSLDLGFNNKIGNKAAKALARHLTLTSLNLSYNQIGSEGASALAGNDFLTSLNLSYNQIDAKGASALASNRFLRSLNLSDNKIGDKGAKALADNHFLTELDLSGNNIGGEGISALAGGNRSLTSLYLRYNDLDDESVKALASHPTLTSLDLSVNRIGDEGAAALKNSSVNKLNLSVNRIGDKGAKALADNPFIIELNLSCNRIGREGASALALAGSRSLTALDLSSNNKIGDGGASALAGHPTLTSLNLSDTGIGDKDAKALAESSSLTSVDLSKNNISDEGAKALARNCFFIQLNLQGNFLTGNEALQAIKQMLIRNLALIVSRTLAVCSVAANVESELKLACLPLVPEILRLAGFNEDNKANDIEKSLRRFVSLAVFDQLVQEKLTKGNEVKEEKSAGSHSMAARLSAPPGHSTIEIKPADPDGLPTLSSSASDDNKLIGSANSLSSTSAPSLAGKNASSPASSSLAVSLQSASSLRIPPVLPGTARFSVVTSSGSRRNSLSKAAPKEYDDYVRIHPDDVEELTQRSSNSISHTVDKLTYRPCLL